MELISLSGQKLKETHFYLDKALSLAALIECQVPTMHLHKLETSALSDLSQAHPICVVETKLGLKVVGGLQTYRIFCVLKDRFIAERHVLFIHICSSFEGKRLAQLESFTGSLLVSPHHSSIKALARLFKEQPESLGVQYFKSKTGVYSSRELASFLDLSRGALFKHD